MPRHLRPYAPKLCEFDVVFPNRSAVGCAPTEPRPWAADHFHALVDGRPCKHRHHSWQGLYGMHPEIPNETSFGSEQIAEEQERADLGD